MSYQISQAGLGFVEAEEGCVLHVYPDAIGRPTVGTGRLLAGMTLAQAYAAYPNGITQAQADAFLLADMQVAANAVNAAVTVPLSQNQFDALCSFTFNLGAGSLNSSTLLRLLNSGDYDGAAAQFHVWDMAGGQVLTGLYKRRVAESRIFASGDYTPSTSPAFQC